MIVSRLTLAFGFGLWDSALDGTAQCVVECVRSAETKSHDETVAMSSQSSDRPMKHREVTHLLQQVASWEPASDDRLWLRLMFFEGRRPEEFATVTANLGSRIENPLGTVHFQSLRENQFQLRVLDLFPGLRVHALDVIPPAWVDAAESIMLKQSFSSLASGPEPSSNLKAIYPIRLPRVYAITYQHYQSLLAGGIAFDAIELTPHDSRWQFEFRADSSNQLNRLLDRNSVWFLECTVDREMRSQVLRALFPGR